MLRILLSLTACCLASTVLVAGDLEPPAAPAPTMKTIDETYGAWNRLLPASERFRLVMNNDEAVWDRETNLVWQRTPTSCNGFGCAEIWRGRQECAKSFTGGRGGWRLPTAAEMMSLVDPTQSDPPLPVGHPFIAVDKVYLTSDWSPESQITTSGNHENILHELQFTEIVFTGVGFHVQSPTRDPSGLMLCVRGPT
jgi:hypothetical protein